MFESGYYPAGAEFNTNAPWNEKEVPERDFEVNATFTLTKQCQITTNDYVPEESGQDEDGWWYDEISTQDTDWEAAYKENYKTPLELIEILKKKCEDELAAIGDMKHGTYSKRRELQNIIDSCKGWAYLDFDIDEA